MIQEDQYGLNERDVNGLLALRQDRLDQMDLDRHRPQRVLVPRLAEISKNPILHLQEAFERLQLDPYQSSQPVDDTLAKIAVSNFDEWAERQRFIKYDRLWERAEAIYAEKKRGIAALMSAFDK
jgi:hypothetical protein